MESWGRSCPVPVLLSPVGTGTGWLLVACWGSGFLRMLFGLFPGYIPHMWKIEIAICSHDNDAGECCCSLLAVPGTQGPF